jgi:hypothetical protein
MDKANWDRLAAAGGIVGIVLFVIAAFVMGSPPDADASATSVLEFFQDKREHVLWAIFLQGLGVLAILWFVAALVTSIRDAGEPRLAVAGFGAYVLGFAIGAAGAMALAGAAFGAAESADPGSVAALYHVGRICDTFSALLFAGLPLAVAAATLRTRLFPAWWAWVSFAFIAWSVVGATAFSRDGFWSPDGAGMVSYIAFMLWVLGTSILLTLRTKPAEQVVAQPSVG